MNYYDIPTGIKETLYNIKYSTGKGGDILFDSLVRPFGGVFQTKQKLGSFQNQLAINMIVPVTPKTDIKCIGAATANNISAAAAYSILLKDI